MRRCLSGLAALAAVSAAAVAVPPLAGAAPVTAAAPARVIPAAAALRRPAGQGQPLLLLSGQQVMLRPGPDGRLSATDLRPSGLGFSLVIRISFCGRVALVPAAALPFLGRGLDPSLFLVRSLRGAEHGGRLPVRLSWSGGRRPALPGVRITRAGPGSADGFLTARSARAFGAALIRQARADQGRARYGTDGLFAHGLSVRLAGAPAPVRPSRPHFVQHTLTVRATNLAGRPDSGGSVNVFSADNCERFGDPIESGNVFRNGTARFSVPAGHYWAFGDFIDFSGSPMKDRIVILPQFTVTRDTTVRMTARSATSLLGFRTPLPSVTQMTSFAIVRTSTAGAAAAVAWGGFNAPILVSPTTTAPTVGGLQTFSSGQLTSPAGAASPYAYSVDYPAAPGLVPAQHFDVSPQSLATVHERYFQDVPSRGVWSTFGGTFAQGLAGFFGGDFPIRLPGLQTQYLTGAPGVVWSSMYAEFAGSSGFGGGQTAAYQEFAAGQDVTQDWNRYPLHTGASQVLSPALPDQAIPAAARSGNLLALLGVPFSDSQPGHTGSGLAPGARTHPSGRYTLTAGGRLIAAGRVGDPLLLASLPSAPSMLRFTLAARRAGPAYHLSGASRTVWTWRSARAPQARVPASWLCAARRGGMLIITRQCAVQPMMTLGYLVHGLGLHGTAPAGPQVVDITAGHLQLARAAAVTGATASVSFDGGAHWRPATVTRQGAGQFRAAFTAPPGALVTLRVTAKDAAGGSVSDTIQSAYRTAPAGASQPVLTQGRGAVLLTSGAGAMMERVSSGPKRAASTTMTAPACARPRPGRAQCDLRYRVQTTASRAQAAGRAARPRGWGPRALEAAYRLPVSRHSYQTVAVSIPFRIPHLARFLATYRKHYGLPACSAASGCLRIVNQAGHRSPLSASGKGSGWDLEGTLDVSMVSAACPHCRILVVEGHDDFLDSLARTERTAARLGAQVISNSYGTRENGFALTLRRAYVQPGHTVVASSGDAGFTAAGFPADLRDVVSVGGTQLSRAGSARGFAERVWGDPANFAGTGSGCSAYVGKPRWQHDTHCPGRTVADVSAVATNVPVFEPTYGGWVTVAGTSISAPFIAGVYGLAGNADRIGPRHLYTRAGDLFDVTTGSNAVFSTPAEACGNDYLCTAKPGYDAPTGLGTPNGLGAF